MRRILLILSAFVIISGMSCENDEPKETTPFIGTWEWLDDGFIERFIFKDSNKVDFYYKDTLSKNKLNNPSIDNSTYQYNNTLIVFIWNKMGESTADYILSNNTLIFSHNKTNRIITYNKIN